MSNWSRKSRHERGYDAVWDKLRLQVLERDCYLCQCPKCKGGALRLLEANEVHHVIAKADGGSGAMQNLIAVNSECHKRLSLEARGIKPRPRIGLDGYPVAE